MMNKMVIFTIVVVVANSLLMDALGCSVVNDCDCGAVCVRSTGDKRCGAGDRRCTCENGCTVYDMFLPSGTSGHAVYGNTCGCGVYGTAYCSKAAWRNAPNDVPKYEINKNCDKGQ